METSNARFKQHLKQALDRYHPEWESADNKLLEPKDKKAVRRWITIGEGLPTPHNWREFRKKYHFGRGAVADELDSLYALARDERNRSPKSQRSDLEAEVQKNDGPSEEPAAQREPERQQKYLQRIYSNRRLLLLGVGIIGLLAIGLGSLLASRDVRIERNRDWIPQYKMQGDYQLALVPPGCFNMGSVSGRDNEKPIHYQCLDYPFWIGVTEVTQAQYGSPPDDDCNINQVNKTTYINEKNPAYPRNCVTWQDAFDWCAAHGMRLPTEREWEYAARGVESWVYPWGNEADPIKAVVRTNFSNADLPAIMQPAGSKPYDVSWVGARDMAGSLREYTSTIYDTVTLNGTALFTYPYSAGDGRESLTNNGTSKAETAEERASTVTLRVLRGGSFDFGIDRATATFRHYEWHDFLWNDRGIRCAMDTED